MDVTFKTETISTRTKSISTMAPRSRTLPHLQCPGRCSSFRSAAGGATSAKRTGLLIAFLGGWEYDALVHVRSGARFDVTTYDTTSLNNGQTNRPDRVGNGKLSHPTVAKWFDTSAFVVHTTPMTYGNAGINPLYADGQQQLDSSLSKTFHMTERQQVEFRADAFNTFNHPNFSAPDSTVGDDAEGQVSSTSSTIGGYSSRLDIRSRQGRLDRSDRAISAAMFCHGCLHCGETMVRGHDG